VGDVVHVRARESGGGLLAIRITSSGAAASPATVTLQGLADADLLAERRLSVLGVGIDAGNLEIVDENGLVLDSSDLFERLRNNPDAVVEIEGTWSGATTETVWSRLELDD
jgi:hypothetical protein